MSPVQQPWPRQNPSAPLSHPCVCVRSTPQPLPGNAAASLPQPVHVERVLLRGLSASTATLSVEGQARGGAVAVRAAPEGVLLERLHAPCLSEWVLEVQAEPLA